ncbi:MAG: hypothetical protein JXB15_10305 [Anaerolineales bacterium]|nr:hypothetical protein [Anaerolineales bacterium]
MIDWVNLAGNAAWILGCAVALAALSFASWQAWNQGQNLRQQLKQPGVVRWIFLAGFLFCGGLAATAQAIWEIALWALLAALFLVQWALLQRRPSD